MTLSHGITFHTVTLLNIYHPSGFYKNVIEHFFRQLPGEGILLAWMITSEERNRIVEFIENAMPEFGARFQRGPSQLAERIEHRIESDLSEADNDAKLL